MLTMNLHELEQLIKDIESDRTERKESLTDSGKIRQAICAFANDLPGYGQPGYIFIGVNDQGVPTGLPITDELLCTLADMRSDGNIQPFPSMTVQKAVLKGTPVAVVEVQPSDSPPVRYNGRVWIRVGPRRAQATLEEERRLTERRRTGNLPFDQQPVPKTTLTDLDMNLFRSTYLPSAVAPEVLSENQRKTEEQMASLRFLTPDLAAPTVAGILVLGTNPQTWLPGAYLQFVRFDGRDLTDPIKAEKIISGNLITQLQQVDNLIPLHIQHRVTPGLGLRYNEQPDYPREALRQIIMNAIMHRTYEGTNSPVRINWFTDRVEIQNPGGLFGQVTKDNFDRMTDYRNPMVAEAMKALGYVERFGIGIRLARKALAENNNPVPEFIFEPTYVLVTIRSQV
ncbi:MAG: ATP-binding protein [bacterium]